MSLLFCGRPAVRVTRGALVPPLAAQRYQSSYLEARLGDANRDQMHIPAVRVCRCDVESLGSRVAQNEDELPKTCARLMPNRAITSATSSRPGWPHTMSRKIPHRLRPSRTAFFGSTGESPPPRVSSV